MRGSLGGTAQKCELRGNHRDRWVYLMYFGSVISRPHAVHTPSHTHTDTHTRQHFIKHCSLMGIKVAPIVSLKAGDSLIAGRKQLCRPRCRPTRVRHAVAKVCFINYVSYMNFIWNCVSVDRFFLHECYRVLAYAIVTFIYPMQVTGNCETTNIFSIATC